MNEFTETNYKQLTDLVGRDECFFFKDFNLEDKVYRIFNYRLASWTSFMEPSALNCRGIMFDVTDANAIKLVSLPPEKFFNYEEGGVDHTQCKLGDKMIKMDGSLISTYMHNGELYLKSKASLFSSQANVAMKLLGKNSDFKNELKRLVEMGYTVNLEYTSPENRIVISYQTEELTILSARSHDNGENLFATKLKEKLESLGGFNTLINNMVTYENLREHHIEQLSFVDSIRQEQIGEGYVMEFIKPDGQSYLGKVKNLKYIALHHTKDSVNSPKRLFESIINEASDDLRSMFADDQYVLNKIKEMEDHVQPLFNHMVKTVEEFTAANKDLPRKDFAIKTQTEVPQYMGLIMNAYLNKPNNFKEFAIKHRMDMFGVTDAEPELDEDGNPLKKKITPKV
jgi:T4 RnlA family RNA ligase